MAGKDALNYSLEIEYLFKSITNSDTVSRDSIENDFNNGLKYFLKYLSKHNYLGDTNFNYWYEMYKLPDGMKLSEALEDDTLKESLEELIAWVKTLKKNL